MRIKLNHNRSVNNGVAVMTSRQVGNALAVYPSPDRRKAIRQWPCGAAVEWEIDDDSGQPLFIHLTPAQGTDGYLMRDGTHFIFQCSALGTVDPNANNRQTVEETVSDSGVSYRVPFKFQLKASS
jgi:hypothetical protein